jgi:hypothetical protein
MLSGCVLELPGVVCSGFTGFAGFVWGSLVPLPPFESDENFCSAAEALLLLFENFKGQK